MTVVQFSADNTSFIAERQAYSYPRANLTPAQRLDYSTAYAGKNCPAELVGKGEAPFAPTFPSLTARQKHGAIPDASTGALSNGAWVVSVPVETKTLEERKAEMKSIATAKAKARKIGGTTVTIGEGDVALATDYEVGVELLLASKKVGPSTNLGIVTRGHSPVNMSNAIRNSIETAVVDAFAAAVQHEYNLYIAIEAAEDHDALDLIDPESEPS